MSWRGIGGASSPDADHRDPPRFECAEPRGADRSRGRRCRKSGARGEDREEPQRLPAHHPQKIRDAELLRTCRPRMFGGFEYDGEVAVRIALTISAACASTGWTVNGVPNGLLSHRRSRRSARSGRATPTPSPLPASAPTGNAIPVDGGYRLSGKWAFASGCDASSWGKLGAIIKPPGGEPPFEGAFFLLPVATADCRHLACRRSLRHRQYIAVVDDVLIPLAPVLNSIPVPVQLARARRTTTTRSTASPLMLGASMLARPRGWGGEGRGRTLSRPDQPAITRAARSPAAAPDDRVRDDPKPASPRRPRPEASS